MTKKRSGNEGSAKALGGAKALGSSEAPGRLSGSDLDALVGLRGGKGGTSSEYMAGRRAMAYELGDKGLLSSQKLAMEVLYLLPDDFVEFYSTVFHKALILGDSSVMHGRSGGLGKAAGATGMVPGSETTGQAMGSGKRWKNPAFTISDEVAFEVKAMVDRELVKLVGRAHELGRNLRDQRAIESEPHNTRATESMRNSATIGGGTRSPIRCPGLRAEWLDRGDGTPRPKCGLFLKAEYRFCPTCGTRVVKMQADGPVCDQVRQE